MRISREARVLLALVFVAAAAWVWINYFSQSEEAFGSSTVAVGSLSASSTVIPPATPPALTDASSAEAVDAGGSVVLADSSPFGNVSGTDTAATAGADTVSSSDEGSSDGGSNDEGTGDNGVGQNSVSQNSISRNSVGQNSTPSDVAVVAALAPAVAQALPTVQSASGDSVTGDSVTVDNTDPQIVGIQTESLQTESLQTEDPQTANPETATVEGAAVSPLPSVAAPTDGAEAALEPAVAPDPAVGLSVAPLQDEPLGTGSAEPLSTVATPQPSTAREVEVAELPFLVTEPPAVETEDAAALDLVLARPNGGLRVTVNPFSPILLAPPPDAPQQALQSAPAGAAEFGLAAPTTPSGIVDVPIPNAPPGTLSANVPQTPARVVAPAPQLLTPQTGVVASLPRPLPGGTLPVTPDLLRTTRNASAPADTVTEATGPEVADYATVAALRVPVAVEPPTFSEAAAPALKEPTEASEATPLPLVGLPGRGSAMGNPIAAGTSSLTRFLRDSNYRFTGYVISAVGVGVFRSNTAVAPVVVTLGQVVPGTDIVLTSLKGEQAELTLGDEKQVLILNPGR